MVGMTIIPGWEAFTERVRQRRKPCFPAFERSPGTWFCPTEGSSLL